MNLHAIIIFAQTVDPSVVAQYGLPGAILFWFMFRAERRLGQIEAVIGDLAKSVLLDVVSRDSAPEKVREQAEAIMDRIDKRSR